MRLSYAYLNEHREWALQQASDPCARAGHACRCPRPDIEALVEQRRAEAAADEQRFRALFTPPAAARRERLAELDALTDQIEPLLDRLDHAWHAVETDLDTHRSSR